MKLYKDNILNRIIVEKIDVEDSKYNKDNYKFLGNIIKEKDKYYFNPLLIDLGNDKENVNDVSWLIYNKKTEPEINRSYIIKEGDIIKMGNVIFQIKMIQINENEDELNKNNNDIESNNNTLLISGSCNHSLVLNQNYDNINIASKKMNTKRNSTNSEKKKNLPPEKDEKISEEKNFAKQTKKNKICRICYQEEDDILLNPLIRPCKCSGSVKYIHLKCLLNWLKSRTSNNTSTNSSNNNNDYFNAYFINQRTECELCKELFPDYIKHHNIKYCLIDFDYAQENKIKENNNNNEQNYQNTNMDNNNFNSSKNNNEKSNFIVLDTVFPLTDNNKYRYIVKFNKKNEMNIGRGLNNQLVLNEITVSRNHCLFKLQKNKNGNYEIIMEDEISKFGTLILVQTDKIEIIKGRPLHLQVSNVHLVMEIKKNNSLLSCCNAEVIDNKNSYEKMNYRAVKNKNIINILTEINSDDGGDNERKENKNKNGKEITTNKKNEENKKILLLNKNNNKNADSNTNQNDNENKKTIPKENCNKNNIPKIENKDDNKNEDNNDSVEVDVENDN